MVVRASVCPSVRKSRLNGKRYRNTLNTKTLDYTYRLYTMCVSNPFYYVYANAFCHLLIKRILID